MARPSWVMNEAMRKQPVKLQHPRSPRGAACPSPCLGCCCLVPVEGHVAGKRRVASGRSGIRPVGKRFWLRTDPCRVCKWTGEARYCRHVVCIFFAGMCELRVGWASSMRVGGCPAASAPYVRARRAARWLRANGGFAPILAARALARYGRRRVRLPAWFTSLAAALPHWASAAGGAGPESTPTAPGRRGVNWAPFGL